MYERKPGALSVHGTSPPLIPIQALICGRLKKHGEAGIWLENQASELPLLCTADLPASNDAQCSPIAVPQVKISLAW